VLGLGRQAGDRGGGDGLDSASHVDGVGDEGDDQRSGSVPTAGRGWALAARDRVSGGARDLFLERRRNLQTTRLNSISPFDSRSDGSYGPKADTPSSPTHIFIGVEI
jgi:hypothetical protein